MLIDPTTEVIVSDPPRRRGNGRPFIASWSTDVVPLRVIYSPGPQGWPSDAFNYEYKIPDVRTWELLFQIEHDGIPDPGFGGLTGGRAYNAFVRGRYPVMRV